jgi:hypothetical protein
MSSNNESKGIVGRGEFSVAEFLSGDKSARINLPLITTSGKKKGQFDCQIDIIGDDAGQKDEIQSKPSAAQPVPLGATAATSDKIPVGREDKSAALPGLSLDSEARPAEAKSLGLSHKMNGNMTKDDTSSESNGVAPPANTAAAAVIVTPVRLRLSQLVAAELTNTGGMLDGQDPAVRITVGGVKKTTARCVVWDDVLVVLVYAMCWGRMHAHTCPCGMLGLRAMLCLSLSLYD